MYRYLKDGEYLKKGICPYCRTNLVNRGLNELYCDTCEVVWSPMLLPYCLNFNDISWPLKEESVMRVKSNIDYGSRKCISVLKKKELS